MKINNVVNKATAFVAVAVGAMALPAVAQGAAGVNKLSLKIDGYPACQAEFASFTGDAEASLLLKGFKILPNEACTLWTGKDDGNSGGGSGDGGNGGDGSGDGSTGGDGSGDGSTGGDGSGGGEGGNTEKPTPVGNGKMLGVWNSNPIRGSHTLDYGFINSNEKHQYMYYEIPLSTFSKELSGRISAQHNNGQSHMIQMWISAQPGGSALTTSTTASGTNRCHVAAVLPNLRWSSAKNASSMYCKLNGNQTYYLNFSDLTPEELNKGTKKDCNSRKCEYIINSSF